MTNISLHDYVVTKLLGGARGGFATRLADAWLHADSTNKEKLEKAFPNIFDVPNG